MERVVAVGIREGLHARPAALFVKEAQRQPVPVSIGKVGGERVSTASILGVMALGATAGDDVVLATEGDGTDDEEALDALTAFLSQEAVA